MLVYEHASYQLFADISLDTIVEDKLTIDLDTPQSASPQPVTVRKEFPETWIWQSIAPKRLAL